MEKIFVQIPSYRDKECQHTIRDLFKQAEHPERIRVAVCWQYVPGEDNDLLVIDGSYRDKVALDLVDAAESKGVCWARARLNSMYNGEEFTLMIDSHTRFVKNWDSLLISELKKCESNKPVISNHPPGYTPPDTLKQTDNVTKLVAKNFDAAGVIRVRGEFLSQKPGKPVKGTFVSPGFLFTLGSMIKEVPYDPNYYYNEEEMVLAARLYTSGWDVFVPTKNFLYHYYINAQNSTEWRFHWNDNNSDELRKISRMRYQYLFGISEDVDATALKDISNYSLGKVRTLEDFERLSGLHFKSRMIAEGGQTTSKKQVASTEDKPVAKVIVNHPDAKDFKPGIEVPSELSSFSHNLAFTSAFAKSSGKNLENIFDSEKPLPIKRITDGIPPGILVLEKFMHQEVCEVVRDYADSVIGKKLQILDHNKTTKAKVETKDSETRITEYVSINGMSGEILSIFIDIYTRRLEPFYNVSFEWFERPQILRYLPGGKYNRHADSEHLDKTLNKWVRGVDRDYSVLLYLNEEYEGGTIYFPNFNFRIKPKTGMLVAFPADNRYLHEAEPTLSGKRYVIVSWGAIKGSPRVRDKAPHAAITLNTI